MYKRAVGINEDLYLTNFIKIAKPPKIKKIAKNEAVLTKLQIILKYIIKISDKLIKKQSNE